MSGEERKTEQLFLKQAVEFLVYRKSDGKVLLERRINPNKSYSGRVTIPSGKVELEKDRDPDEAVFREVQEERGIKPIKIFKLDTFENITPGLNHYLVSAYLITDYEGNAKNTEPEKAEDVWVEIDEAKNLLDFVNSKYILLLAKQKLIEEGLLKD